MEKPKKKNHRITKVRFEAWYAEGVRRFGTNEYLWKFECPACGHVQCGDDFIPLECIGASTDDAHSCCIGSISKRISVVSSGPGPCDYTSAGPIDICPVEVNTGNGAFRSFQFACV